MKQLNEKGYTAEELLLDALEHVRANPELNERHMSTHLTLVVGTDDNIKMLSTFTFNGGSSVGEYNISREASGNIMDSALAAMGETNPTYLDMLTKFGGEE